MVKLALAALALVTLAACGGAAQKPTETAGGGSPGASAAPEGAASRVELGEMTLGDGKKIVKVHADGTIEAPDGKPMGTLTAGGSIIVQGKAIATLGADGNVAMGDGVKETATIGEDGVLTFKGKNETFTVTIGADGLVGGTNPSAGKLVITGADTPGKKRAAMLVLIVMVTTKSSPPPPPAVGPTTP